LSGPSPNSIRAALELLAAEIRNTVSKVRIIVTTKLPFTNSYVFET
jgi:hypothetical protein